MLDKAKPVAHETDRGFAKSIAAPGARDNAVGRKEAFGDFPVAVAALAAVHRTDHLPKALAALRGDPIVRRWRTLGERGPEPQRSGEAIGRHFIERDHRSQRLAIPKPRGENVEARPSGIDHVAVVMFSDRAAGDVRRRHAWAGGDFPAFREVQQRRVGAGRPGDGIF